MNVIQFLNEGNSLISLVEKYKLVNITSAEFPHLHVLNYTIKSPKFHIFTLECRGLVIAKIEGKYHVVAKSFFRFYDKKELSNKKMVSLKFNWEECIGTTKEDGSLMLLYYFPGTKKWHINTRFNFGKGKFSAGFYQKIGVQIDESMTYEKLFKNIIEKDGKKFDDVTEKLDKSCTYVFEMCSGSYNRVVTRYKEPTLYLISIIILKRRSGTYELQSIKEENWENIVKTSELMGVSHPQVIENIKSPKMAEEYIIEKIKTDPTFEGLVVVDNKKKRLKIKNPCYLFLHNLRYDRVIEPSPNDIFTFVYHCDREVFLEALKFMGVEKKLKKKIIKCFDESREKIFSCLDYLFSLWVKHRNAPKKSIFVEKVKKAKAKIVSVEYYMQEKNVSREKAFDQKKEKEKFLNFCWKMENQLLNSLFPNSKNKKSVTTRTQSLKNLEGAVCNLQQYINITKKFSKKKGNQLTQHARRYSGFTEIEKECFNIVSASDKKNIKSWWKDPKFLEIKSNGICEKVPEETKSKKWNVFCFCGEEMILYIIPVRERLYKCIRQKCKHCVKPRHFRQKECAVYRCKKCGAQHGCHQEDKNYYTKNGVLQRSFAGKPFGYPTSTIGLVIRHLCHEIFDELFLSKKMSRGEAYGVLGHLLGQDPREVHIGCFDVPMCLKVIDLIIEYRKENSI